MIYIFCQNNSEKNNIGYEMNVTLKKHNWYFKKQKKTFFNKPLKLLYDFKIGKVVHLFRALLKRILTFIVFINKYLVLYVKL